MDSTGRPSIIACSRASLLSPLKPVDRGSLRFQQTASHGGAPTSLMLSVFFPPTAYRPCWLGARGARGNAHAAARTSKGREDSSLVLNRARLRALRQIRIGEAGEAQETRVLDEPLPNVLVPATNVHDMYVCTMQARQAVTAFPPPRREGSLPLGIVSSTARLEEGDLPPSISAPTAQEPSANTAFHA